MLSCLRLFFYYCLLDTVLCCGGVIVVVVLFFSNYNNTLFVVHSRVGNRCNEIQIRITMCTVFRC